MRVGILGGTGFVGCYLVDALLAREHQPVLLVRSGSEDRVTERTTTETLVGGSSDRATIEKLAESTDALKKYVTEKMTQCVRKYASYDADVHAVLSVEKRDHIAEVNVRSKGLTASAKAVTVDLYSAIDKVVDTIHAQLRKKKERLLRRSSRVSVAP